MAEPAALPRISVVVPVYNGEATIRSCVEAILGLDYPRDLLQTFIVDNRSTDGTRKILERYPVTVLEEAKTGVAPGSTTVTYRIQGDLLPAETQTDFTWEFKLELSIVGTVKVQVVN